ncbi:hypothetical protein ROHU_026518 [Labeo rohita]|uniref:Uncharacterized protein n=1 Tax=Labeo rohita TaxID=84645 RepID=A0A498MEZ6_LABRO|nr:hypothetical protein ROHU_026518 [Labeo rohita]
MKRRSTADHTHDSDVLHSRATLCRQEPQSIINRLSEITTHKAMLCNAAFLRLQKTNERLSSRAWPETDSFLQSAADLQLNYDEVKRVSLSSHAYKSSYSPPRQGGSPVFSGVDSDLLSVNASEAGCCVRSDHLLLFSHVTLKATETRSSAAVLAELVFTGPDLSTRALSRSSCLRELNLFLGPTHLDPRHVRPTAGLRRHVWRSRRVTRETAPKIRLPLLFDLNETTRSE